MQAVRGSVRPSVLRVRLHEQPPPWRFVQGMQANPTVGVVALLFVNVQFAASAARSDDRIGQFQRHSHAYPVARRALCIERRDNVDGRECKQPLSSVVD